MVTDQSTSHMMQAKCPGSEAVTCNAGKVVVQPEKKARRRSLTGRCASLVKEQRARIYILRRCATMLLCWYIQGDD